MTTLLQKAKEQKPKVTEITDEHVDLVLAYLKSEITLAQLNRALGNHPQSPKGYITITRTLKKYYDQNKRLPE